MNNDQYAFPRYGGSLGMSLLDYFAANAMVMLCLGTQLLKVVILIVEMVS